MSNNVKRILAALLVVIGGILLVQLTEDRFVRMFIVACILFAATFMNKRAMKRRDLARLHAQLEKELDEEEKALASETEATEIVDEVQDQKLEEDKQEEIDSDNPK